MGAQLRPARPGKRCVAQLVVRRGVSAAGFFSIQPQKVYRPRPLARLVGLSDCPSSAVKPKLLVAELWGLGDLVIATPFLQAASERYTVTVLAKPYARDLQTRLWPSVRVVPFVAPWTAFKHKYRLLNWPWEEILRLRRQLAAERFDFGLSARWDPRDHFLLWVARVKMRLGFPRMGSQLFLAKPLARPDPAAHRYEHWQVMARALGFELPARDALALARH